MWWLAMVESLKDCLTAETELTASSHIRLLIYAYHVHCYLEADYSSRVTRRYTGTTSSCMVGCASDSERFSLLENL